MMQQLEQQYGYVFEKELLKEIANIGKYKKLEVGEELIDYGQTMEYIPLLLSGAIKVMRENKEGKEMVLYFLERGDTCAFTLNCCIGNKKSEVRAIAETDSEILLLPVAKIDEWMCEYRSWRAYILNSYYFRINEMLETIDTIAFVQLDNRIHKYLKDKAMVSGDTKIKTTHQEIANDLNSSRVVVSRLLKQLENEGKIKLGRNVIEVVDL